MCMEAGGGTIDAQRELMRLLPYREFLVDLHDESLARRASNARTNSLHQLHFDRTAAYLVFSSSRLLVFSCYVSVS
jgi:hypothetical protein